jgi:hypothetical protein
MIYHHRCAPALSGSQGRFINHRDADSARQDEPEIRGRLVADGAVLASGCGGLRLGAVTSPSINITVFWGTGRVVQDWRTLEDANCIRLQVRNVVVAVGLQLLFQRYRVASQRF